MCSKWGELNRGARAHFPERMDTNASGQFIRAEKMKIFVVQLVSKTDSSQATFPGERE
jgi:hypothetical protein